MDLPLVGLENFGAKLIESSDGFAVTSATTGLPYAFFPHAPDPASMAGRSAEQTTIPGRATQQAIRAMLEFDSATSVIARNDLLSDRGKSEKLAEPRERALKTLLAAHVDLDKNVQGLAAQESQRYALPAWDSKDIATVLLDGEIRTYLRSMPKHEREVVLQTVGEGQDSAMLRAILRSPLPMDNLTRAAHTGWTSRIDREDALGRELLNIAAKSVEWGQRCIAITQGVLLPRLKYPREELFNVVGNAGARYFQIDPEEIAMFERGRVARQFAAAR